MKKKECIFSSLRVTTNIVSFLDKKSCNLASNMLDIVNAKYKCASPLVSVIITTYNYATYLPRAIESVLTQTYKNIEIIVIDDGSSDNAASVIPTIH